MIRSSELIIHILKEELPSNMQLWNIVNQRNDEIVAARELEKYCTTLLFSQRKEITSIGQNIVSSLLRKVLWLDVLKALQGKHAGGQRITSEFVQTISLKASNSAQAATQRSYARIKSWS